MKPDSRLRTGWICIATEGNSIDGRYISREILTEMAESYDPEHYCALIWPDHNHYGNNAGTVEALKAEAVDGKMKLFAVLRPTRDLIYWNQIGQYQFCSIEPKADFAESGKFYLGGLGVTDRPASTGTTQMQFSAKKPDEPRFIGQSEDLNLNAFAEQGREEGMFKKFMAWFKTQEEPPAPHATTPEDPAMDEKQFNELKGLIGGIADKQTELEGKIETFSKKKSPPRPKSPSNRPPA